MHNWERDVLITLKWQLVGLPRQLSGVLIWNYCNWLDNSDRKGRSPQLFLNGQVKVWVLGCGGHNGSWPRRVRLQMHQSSSWCDILMSSKGGRGGKSQRCNPYYYTSSTAQSGSLSSRNTVPEHPDEYFLLPAPPPPTPTLLLGAAVSPSLVDCYLRKLSDCPALDSALWNILRRKQKTWSLPWRSYPLGIGWGMI